MNINDAYPSKYLKADDLQGRKVTVIMADVKTEEVGKQKDFKAILYFKGKDKGMVLNKTNARKISEAYGPETNEWFGQPITLYEAQVEFQGDTVAALRVAIPTASTPTQRTVEHQRPIDEDRVPDRREPQRDRRPELVGASNFRGDLDDDIPFMPEMRG